MFVQVHPPGGRRFAGRLRAEGLLDRPASHRLEDRVLPRPSARPKDERRQADGAKTPSNGDTRLARRGGFSIADVPIVGRGSREVRGLSPLRERWMLPTRSSGRRGAWRERGTEALRRGPVPAQAPLSVYLAVGEGDPKGGPDPVSGSGQRRVADWSSPSSSRRV